MISNTKSYEKIPLVKKIAVLETVFPHHMPDRTLPALEATAGAVYPVGGSAQHTFL